MNRQNTQMWPEIAAEIHAGESASTWWQELATVLGRTDLTIHGQQL